MDSCQIRQTRLPLGITPMHSLLSRLNRHPLAQWRRTPHPEDLNGSTQPASRTESTRHRRNPQPRLRLHHREPPRNAPQTPTRPRLRTTNRHLLPIRRHTNETNRPLGNRPRLGTTPPMQERRPMPRSSPTRITNRHPRNRNRQRPITRPLRSRTRSHQSNRNHNRNTRLTMAIGSDPEIGTHFGLWKDMTDTQRQQWFDYMNTNWNPLMNGYATLVHNKNNPYYQQAEPQ